MTTTATGRPTLEMMAEDLAFSDTERLLIRARIRRDPPPTYRERFDLACTLQKYIDAKRELREALGLR